MKTLASDRDQHEILRRLKQVRPDTTRRWGRMTAPQMICHLSDSYRVVMGLKPVTPTSGFLERTVIKWIALYAPLKWPVGIKTRPEVDQEGGEATCPKDFTADVADLETLVGIFTSQQGSADWPGHPIFGPMSKRDWLRWGYLHMDHHFRQFGV
jgi:hypothetical protein